VWTLGLSTRCACVHNLTMLQFSVQSSDGSSLKDEGRLLWYIFGTGQVGILGEWRKRNDEISFICIKNRRMCWVGNIKCTAICELRTKFYAENMMRCVFWGPSGTNGGHDCININKRGEDRAWIRRTMDSVQCLVTFGSSMNHWLPYNVAKFLTN